MIDTAEEDDCKYDKLQNRASVSIDTSFMWIGTHFLDEVDIRNYAIVSIDTVLNRQEIGHQLRIAVP